MKHFCLSLVIFISFYLGCTSNHFETIKQLNVYIVNMCYSRSQSFVEIRDSSVQILRVTLYKVQKKDDYQEIKSYNLEYKDLKDRMITIMTNDTQVVTRMPSDTVYLGIGISDEKGQKNFFINASKEPLSFD